jgi:hypothetical protein
MTANLLQILVPECVANEDPSILRRQIASWVSESQPISTKHPYGFWVILLHRTEHEEWRFHVWPAGIKPVQGMPAPLHTHERVVESRILQGRLRNLVYDITEVAGGGLPEYEVVHGGDKYSPKNQNRLVKTGRRYAATVRETRDLILGESYSVPAHVFHEAVAPDRETTCTIVRMHAAVLGKVKILGTDGYPEELEFTRLSKPGIEVLPLIDA